jgi:hypothetical protein
MIGRYILNQRNMLAECPECDYYVMLHSPGDPEGGKQPGDLSKIQTAGRLDLLSQAFASGDLPEQMRDLHTILATFLFRRRRTAPPKNGGKSA